MPLRDDESRRAGGSSMALRAAFPATIPVMTGFLCLGTAYGLLMQSKGYGPGWSVLMSAIAFGGSMQFVAVTLLTTAFDPVQAFLLSVMVNARHMFYGLSLLDKYKGLGKVRAFLIYVLCDETFSRRKAWTGGTSTSGSPCWTTSTGLRAQHWAACWGVSSPLTLRAWTLL